MTGGSRRYILSGWVEIWAKNSSDHCKLALSISLLDWRPWDVRLRHSLWCPRGAGWSWPKPCLSNLTGLAKSSRKTPLGCWLLSIQTTRNIWLTSSWFISETFTKFSQFGTFSYIIYKFLVYNFLIFLKLTWKVCGLVTSA